MSQQWQSFGEFAKAVKDSVPAHRRDPRLTTLAAGMSEGVGSEGGFLLPSNLKTDLLMRIYAASLAGRCAPWQMTTGTLSIPALENSSLADGFRYGAVTSAWGVESGTISPSQPKFGELELSANKITAAVTASEELFSDVPALGQFLSQVYGSEIAFRLDDSIVRGSGAGMPLGILNAPATITVSKQLGQPAATITAGNILSMWARMFGPSRDKAVWIANENTTIDLMTLATPIYGTSGVEVVGGTALPGQTAVGIFGRPIVWHPSCSSLGTIGDVILADLSQYALGNRGLRLASSSHLHYLTDQVVTRLVGRFDGMPTWKAPITPKFGTETLSPFVVLATRA